MRHAITNVRALVDGELIDDATVIIDGAQIEAVGQIGVPPGVPSLDGGSMLALPGIIDIHGDAVERAIAPRAASTFAVQMALVENDTAMLAAGITTAFLSLTDSPEPGLRSRSTIRSVIEALRNDDLPLGTDTRVHVRHEILQTDHHPELCDWLEAGDVGIVSLNDHYPVHDDAELRRHAIHLSHRIHAPIEEIEAILRGAWERRDVGEKQVTDIADVCARTKVPMASHDDMTADQVRHSAELGVTISEFPLDVALCHYARSLGVGVVLGAPNLVRGGSHLGRISVSDAIAHDAVDALCSDYHYPSLFCAPFIADCGLGRAWSFVSSEPARLAGLDGRKGTLSPGADADLLLVDESMAPQRTTAAIAAVYRAGSPVLRRHS